jgi:hypothetical protein
MIFHKSRTFNITKITYNYATLFIVNLKLKEDIKIHCPSQISIQKKGQGFLPIISLVIFLFLFLYLCKIMTYNHVIHFVFT